MDNFDDFSCGFKVIWMQCGGCNKSFPLFSEQFFFTERVMFVSVSLTLTALSIAINFLNETFNPFDHSGWMSNAFLCKHHKMFVLKYRFTLELHIFTGGEMLLLSGIANILVMYFWLYEILCGLLWFKILKQKQQVECIVIEIIKAKLPLHVK